MWTVVWVFVKNPKNWLVTALVVALFALGSYSLYQYVTLAFKNAEIGRINVKLEEQTSQITALDKNNTELKKNMEQIQVHLVRVEKLQKKTQVIKTQIVEAKDEKAITDARNNIIDMFNGLPDDQTDTATK